MCSCSAGRVHMETCCALTPKNNEAPQSCSLQHGLTTATVLSEVNLLLPSPWLLLSLWWALTFSSMASCSVMVLQGYLLQCALTLCPQSLQRCQLWHSCNHSHRHFEMLLLWHGLLHSHSHLGCPFATGTRPQVTLFGLSSHWSSSLPRAQEQQRCPGHLPSQEHGHCCYQNVPRPSSQMISSTAKAESSY